MKIEIWSDVVCPFCYIGKRNFEKSLEDFKHQKDIEIEWKSFQLDPSFIQNPNEKTDNTERLSKKYNKPYEDMKLMQENIINTAKNVGLEMRLFDSIQFNTFQAHRLIQKAKEKNLGSEAEEKFFKAHFTECLDLGNKEVLTKIAKEIGLNDAEITDALENDSYALAINKDIQEAQNIGVTGVPFFVINRKYGISGAQPTEAFTQTLEKAYEDWKATQPRYLLIEENGNSCSIDGKCD